MRAKPTVPVADSTTLSSVRIINIRLAKEVYEVIRLLDHDKVLARKGKSRRLVVLPILPVRVDTSKIRAQRFSKSRSEDQLTDKQLDMARHRYAAIRPLLGMKARRKNDVARVAKRLGVAVTAIYRWLNRYGKDPRLVALAPFSRGVKMGHHA